MYIKSNSDTRSTPRILVLGIYNNEEYGLLIVENIHGQLQLPGGRIMHPDGPEPAEKQIQREVLRLQQLVFEKTGLCLDVNAKGLLGTFTYEHTTIKVYLLTQNSTPLNFGWKRNPRFKAYYIDDDPGSVSMLQKLSAKDRYIITYILGNNPDLLLQPCHEVKTIA